MAYENFKETIWAKGIERALLKRCVLENNCNTKFAGEVGEGKKVKILGAARPTVRTYVPGTNINVAEKPSDTGVTLEIDQFKYANFFVDSIEAAQSDADIMQALVDGAADGITELRDAYVGSLAANATNKTTSSSANTEEKAIARVDAALISLGGIGVRSADAATTRRCSRTARSAVTRGPMWSCPTVSTTTGRTTISWSAPKRPSPLPAASTGSSPMSRSCSSARPSRSWTPTARRSCVRTS